MTSAPATDNPAPADRRCIERLSDSAVTSRHRDEPGRTRPRLRRPLARCRLGAGSVRRPTLASFKTTVELVKGPFQPPQVWQWQNYVTAWTDGNLDRFFLNSLVVAVLVVVPSVFLSAMTGYAFARFRFRGSGLLFGFSPRVGGPPTGAGHSTFLSLT